MAKKALTLTEIADRIDAHLRRFESDPSINVRVNGGYSSYYAPFAVRSGAYVVVRYVSYQGGDTLNRERAERYLSWLDAGNVGRHYECERKMKEADA